MAFDKVVDSVALNTELKNLAGILRKKSETTEELDFYAGDFSQTAESIETITAGFTSEKYKKWLEINGYTINEFTLTSQSIDNFNINHTLGRPAKSIICFRADLDGRVITDKICFAFSVEGSTEDNDLNRLRRYENIYIPFFPNLDFGTGHTTHRAILENTAEYIQLRHVSDNAAGVLRWTSGKYYLALL